MWRVPALIARKSKPVLEPLGQMVEKERVITAHTVHIAMARVGRTGDTTVPKKSACD